MAWRDRLRRRATGPATGGRSGESGQGIDRGAHDAPAATMPADGPGPGPAVPADWDGGWRRAAPPRLTVSRAPLGVSDGLTFRAGLAAWQNPTFDNGLGHALLPTAPTGLVRGVTRPAAPSAASAGGGPLLLRAVRADGDDGAQGGASAVVRPGERRSGGEYPATTVARGVRSSGAGATGSVPSSGGAPGSGSAGSGTAGSGAEAVAAGSVDGANSTSGAGSSGSAPEVRGLTSTASSAVLSTTAPAVQRAVTPGAAPVVAPPSDSGRSAATSPIPVVRRVAVVPGASVPPVQRAATGAAEARGEGRPEASRAPGVEVPGAVARPRPVGPRLTVARRVAGPVRHVPALRPAATAPAPGDTTVSGAPGEAVPASAGSPAPASTAVQRAGTRPPLGAPLSELPPTAAPLAQNDPAVPAPGPVLPILQRQAEGTGGALSGGGARGAAQGAGPNGPAFSAVQRQTGDTGGPSSGGGTRGPSQGAGPDGPALSFVQRQSDGAPGASSGGGARGATQGAGPDGPAPAPGSGPRRPGARARGGLGAPLPALPPSADVPGARVPRTASDVRAPVEASPGRGEGAPLLGAVEVQRSLADPTATGAATRPADPQHGGPATPLVTPSAAAASSGLASGGPAGSAERPTSASGGTGPGPVVARAMSADAGAAAGAGAGRPVVGRSVTGPFPGATSTGAGATARGTGRSAGSASGGPGAGGPVAARAASGGPAVGGPGTARAASGGSRSGGPATSGGPRTTGPAPESTSAPRPSATHTPRPRTGPLSAPTATLPTLSLLPDRPLTLNTRAPEGVAPTAAASRTGGTRPVVPARWAPAPTTAGAAPATPAGTAARPAPAPSPGPAPTPQVQRAATTHRPHDHDPAVGTPHPPVRGAGSSGAVRRVPVVRPAPPRTAPGSAAAPVPARSLPVTAPQTAPLAAAPTVTAAPAPAGPVPVVAQRTVKSGPAPARPQAPSTGGVGGSGSGRGPATVRLDAAADSPQDPGADLDDLARRLLDPVARLLRTELRRGRERTGRPYDGRR